MDFNSIFLTYLYMFGCSYLEYSLNIEYYASRIACSGVWFLFWSFGVSKLATVWSRRDGSCARCASRIELGAFMIAAGSMAFLKASLSVFASFWADSTNPYWFGPRWHWFTDFSNALTLYRLPFWSTFTRSIPSVLARFPRRPWAVSWSTPAPLAN